MPYAGWGLGVGFERDGAGVAPSGEPADAFDSALVEQGLASDDWLIEQGNPNDAVKIQQG